MSVLVTVLTVMGVLVSLWGAFVVYMGLQSYEATCRDLIKKDLKISLEACMKLRNTVAITLVLRYGAYAALLFVLAYLARSR